jgi:hypothetical protein
LQIAVKPTAVQVVGDMSQADEVGRTRSYCLAQLRRASANTPLQAIKPSQIRSVSEFGVFKALPQRWRN